MQSFFINLPPLRRPLFIPVGGGFSGGVFTFTRPNFFHLLTDEGVAALFLQAVAADVEQARAFVSKNSAVDLDALQNILDQALPLDMIGLKKANGRSMSTRLRTRSVLLQNCILHLHMVEEPDQFGPWKIYGVDKENR